MESIIGILFYDSFIELPGGGGEQTKHLRKSKDSFNSPGHVKQGEKNMLHKYVASDGVKSHYTKDIFAILL